MDTDDRVEIARRQGRVKGEEGEGDMVTGGDLTWGCEHTGQHTEECHRLCT